MKKNFNKDRYLVVGNPIEHSLSPLLHNYWMKKNRIHAIYEKKKLANEDLKNIIEEIRNKEIKGINITVPHKKNVIPYLDTLSDEAQETQSVNTIYLDNQKIVGHNTDIKGFEFAIKETKYDVANKKIFILGAGGVVPSIVFALYKMNVSEIIICNRTKSKAENLRDLFKNLQIIEWGDIPNFDLIINATSIGLNNTDTFDLDFSKFKKGKFFYDVIYNPNETIFLKKAKELGNKTENGKKMFIYQAAEAFKIWHGVQPKIDQETIKLIKS